MKLLNTGSLQIRDFKDDRAVPSYAILSHTWDENEVVYDELRLGKPIGEDQRWAKISSAAQKAVELGLSWIWIDTCCIDQSSVVDVSIAINSMFRWYEAAECCFVHLSDVSANTDDDLIRYDQFRKSRWFTRGWTLQELLASPNVGFFDQQWKALGSLESFSEDVSEVTGIPVDVLKHRTPLGQIDAWTKLRWASHRKCSRIEDEAYCLLGVFGLSMTVIYGEGNTAFNRLIVEVARTLRQPWPVADMYGQALAHTVSPPDTHTLIRGATTPSGRSCCSQFACGFASSPQGSYRRLSPHPKRTACVRLPERRYACPSCPLHYSRHSDLQRHNRSKHCGITKKFPCDRCPYSSKRKDKLVEHVRRMHADVCAESAFDRWQNQGLLRHQECSMDRSTPYELPSEGTSPTWSETSAVVPQYGQLSRSLVYDNDFDFTPSFQEFLSTELMDPRPTIIDLDSTVTNPFGECFE